MCNCQVGLSTMDFFDTFMADDATYNYEKFYQSKQAKNIQISLWREPAEDEKTFEGSQVHKMRTIEAEFKVDSTFVKAAPTIKTYRILEFSPTQVKILCINRTRDIPYCDTFDVQELLTVNSMKPTSKCCVVQIGIFLNWHKSTMMKSMIKGSTEKESQSMLNDYKGLL